MNKRHIIIISGLISLGFISTNVLRANIIQKEHLKDESILVSEIGIPGSDVKSSFQEDSTGKNTFGEADVVNLPFGKSNRKYTTGAITVFNPEDLLKYNSIQDVGGAIYGLFPGSLGGLNMRGLGNALVVIDGIPRPISSVNIEEIAQITVLKDVNASVLYGVQGYTGVILITTKCGQPNMHKVNVSVEQGFSTPISLPKYLGSADYMELYNEALANDGLPALYTQKQIDGTRSKTKPAMYPDADYYTSEFLKNSKPATRVVTQFSGGNENAQYYLTAGYLSSGSLLNMGEGKNDNTKRLNLRSNINFRINDFIKSYVDIVAVWDINRRANGNYWSDASTLRPNLYTPLIDTGLVTNKQYVPTATLINGRYMVGGRIGYLNNVWANLNLAGYYNQINTSVQFNNGIDVDLKSITKGLSFKTFIGFDFYNQFQETQSNTYAVYQPVWSLGPNNEDLLSLNKIGVDKFSGTQGVANSILMRNISVFGLLDYSRVFGIKHALEASLVAFADNYTHTDTLQSAKHSNLGMRINYAYNNKYVLDFSSALVSSTKLYPGNRVGLSPSLAAAWIISEEDFLKNNSFVNYLKLKFSISKLLTDLTIPRYFSYEGIYTSSGRFNWSDGVRGLNASSLSTERNYNLFYQARKEINVGIEAVLLNKSLWVDANIFRERNTNIVSRRINSYPGFLGSFYPFENYGEEKYSGFEIGATWRKPINTSLRIEIGANMVYVKSEVVKTDERWGFDYLYRTGKPVSAMFGLEAIGLFKDQADIDNSLPQSFGTVKPGDIKYKDQNGDGIIDINDQVMIGQSDPNFAGGLTIKLGYKNLTLFAQATGRSGSERYFNDRYYWVYADMKYSEVVLGRWTPATASTATYPRLTTQANSNNFQASTFWLYDNSLITIDCLQLSYDIPNYLSSKLTMKNLNLYIRASNLATLSKYSYKMQLNTGAEPQYRYYAVGLKASF